MPTLSRKTKIQPGYKNNPVWLRALEKSPRLATDLRPVRLPSLFAPRPTRIAYPHLRAILKRLAARQVLHRRLTRGQVRYLTKNIRLRATRRYIRPWKVIPSVLRKYKSKRSSLIRSVRVAAYRDKRMAQRHSSRSMTGAYSSGVIIEHTYPIYNRRIHSPRTETGHHIGRVWKTRRALRAEKNLKVGAARLAKKNKKRFVKRRKKADPMFNYLLRQYGLPASAGYLRIRRSMKSSTGLVRNPLISSPSWTDWRHSTIHKLYESANAPQTENARLYLAAKGAKVRSSRQISALLTGLPAVRIPGIGRNRPKMASYTSFVDRALRMSTSRKAHRNARVRFNWVGPVANLGRFHALWQYYIFAPSVYRAQQLSSVRYPSRAQRYRSQLNLRIARARKQTRVLVGYTKWVSNNTAHLSVPTSKRRFASLPLQLKMRSKDQKQPNFHARVGLLRDALHNRFNDTKFINLVLALRNRRLPSEQLFIPPWRRAKRRRLAEQGFKLPTNLSEAFVSYANKPSAYDWVVGDQMSFRISRFVAWPAEAVPLYDEKVNAPATMTRSLKVLRGASESAPLSAYVTRSELLAPWRANMRCSRRARRRFRSIRRRLARKSPKRQNALYVKRRIHLARRLHRIKARRNRARGLFQTVTKMKLDSLRVSRANTLNPGFALAPLVFDNRALVVMQTEEQKKREREDHRESVTSRYQKTAQYSEAVPTLFRELISKSVRARLASKGNAASFNHETMSHLVSATYWSIRMYINDPLRRRELAREDLSTKLSNEDIRLQRAADKQERSAELRNSLRFRLQPNIRGLRRSMSRMTYDWLRVFFPRKYTHYIEDRNENASVLISARTILAVQPRARKFETWRSDNIYRDAEKRYQNFRRFNRLNSSARFETLLATQSRAIGNTLVSSHTPIIAQMKPRTSFFSRSYSTDVNLISRHVTRTARLVSRQGREKFMPAYNQLSLRQPVLSACVQSLRTNRLSSYTQEMNVSGYDPRVLRAKSPRNRQYLNRALSRPSTSAETRLLRGYQEPSEAALTDHQFRTTRRLEPVNSSLEDLRAQRQVFVRRVQ